MGRCTLIATLLLVVLETGRVHTAVHYPDQETCVTAMHEAVDRYGGDAVYSPDKNAYTDSKGRYILYCE